MPREFVGPQKSVTLSDEEWGLLATLRDTLGYRSLSETARYVIARNVRREIRSATYAGVIRDSVATLAAEAKVPLHFLEPPTQTKEQP